jgi:tetratricopeptide (TPR) repeat protein
MSGRRTLWQILAVYVGASWVVLQVVDVVKDNMGLPDWVFPFALLLLLVGLPIIVATAMVQGRHAAALEAAAAAPVDSQQPAPPMPEPAAHHKLLTWRNAVLGGGLAIVLLTVVTTGFMFMRNRGIGPVGSLVAKGLLEERSQILVADFEAQDNMLGRMVAEALSVDLSQSDIVRLVEPKTVESALARMEREESTPVDEDLAREIATREGIPAVVGGEILSAGGSYVITAHLLTADGELLANARATAADSTRIIEAIDKLSRDLREQIGESYTSMRKSPPLAHVTTGSLEALRKYTEARVQRTEGNLDAAIALLEDAVAIDSTFAMAYRAIGVFLQNKFEAWTRQHWAYSKAYEYRERLTEREKWLVTAAYYINVEDDPAQAIAAYENVLRVDPDNSAATNNIGVVYYFRRDWENALRYYRRADEMEPTGLTASNVGAVFANMGRLDEADSLFAEAVAREPNSPAWKWYRVAFEHLRGDREEAKRLSAELRQSESADLRWVSQTEGVEWLLSAEVGRLAAGESHYRAALDAAERRDGPDGLDVALAQAELDLALGDVDSARRRIREALDRYLLEDLPPLDRPTAYAVSLLAQTGEPDAARDLLSVEREKLGPELAKRSQSEFEVAEAWIDVAEGRYDEAIPALREADGGFACQPCADHSVGRAFDVAERPDSAIAYYEKYLEPAFNFRLWLDGPWRAWTLERLGQLYDEQGDLEQAAGYYGLFAELWQDADPELQPRVRAARDRMEAIVRKRG